MFSLWPCYQISLNKSDISDKPNQIRFLWSAQQIHKIQNLWCTPWSAQLSSAHPTKVCTLWPEQTRPAQLHALPALQSAVTDCGSYWQILAVVWGRMQLGAIQEISQSQQEADSVPYLSPYTVTKQKSECSLVHFKKPTHPLPHTMLTILILQKIQSW